MCLLQHNNVEVVLDSCWPVFYLMDASNELIDVVLQAGLVPLLVQLLTSVELSIVVCGFEQVSIKGCDM